MNDREAETSAERLMDISAVSQPGQALPAVAETQNPNWLVENRELIRTVKAINSAELFGEDSELTFALDRETRRPVVRVISRRTQQVLLQIPPEYVLALDRALNGRRPDQPGAQG
jgi:uncharacterized FlaG/YvyC family protein